MNIKTELKNSIEFQPPFIATKSHFLCGSKESKENFYHPDHLGSSSWITDSGGHAIQHLQYLPFGETRVDQRTTSWSSRYSFSAKEKDEESGYGYFGARYYNSDLSIWLSVDPLASKYPNLSPYAYVANNPIKLVDPNGMEIVISGDDAGAALSQLNKSTNLKLGFGKDGKTVEIVGGKVKNKADRLLQKAVGDQDIKVNIEAKKENSFTWQDGVTLPTEGGGGYGGNEIVDGKVNTFQKVVPNMLDAKDNLVDGISSGGYMLHEVAESYFGGKMAKKSGVSSPRDGLDGSTYEAAHKQANKIIGGNLRNIIERETILTPIGQPVINPFTKQPMVRDIRNYWSRY